MGFLNGCGGALSAMAHYAAEFIQLVGDHRMSAERLHTHVSQAGFLQSDVTGRAAVYHAEIWKPDLLNSALQMALQGNRVAAAPDQTQVLILIMAPLAKMVLSRSNSQRNQQEQADHTKGADGVAEQFPPHREKRILR
jgi:hypothetical protein